MNTLYCHILNQTLVHQRPHCLFRLAEALRGLKQRSFKSSTTWSLLNRNASEWTWTFCAPRRCSTTEPNNSYQVTLNVTLDLFLCVYIPFIIFVRQPGQTELLTHCCSIAFWQVTLNFILSKPQKLVILHVGNLKYVSNNSATLLLRKFIISFSSFRKVLTLN